MVDNGIVAEVENKWEDLNGNQDSVSRQYIYQNACGQDIFLRSRDIR